MRLLLYYLVLSAATVSSLDASEAEDLMGLYGTNDMVSIATGYRTHISSAPGVTTVITAQDITNIGATRLEDVLETVPGLHVSNARGFSSVYGFRGIYTETNSQVLVLINGFPVRDVVTGGRGVGWSMPVNNISRIEIVRGPGSALYGADAIAGVINVITKTAAEIDGAEVGTHFGSHNTMGGWLLYGSHIGPVDITFSAEGLTTDGHDRTITRDAQTVIDQAFRTRASLAPGPINTGRDDIDIRLDLAYHDTLRIRAGFQGFYDIENGAGAALALDPDGFLHNRLYNADLTYKKAFTKTMNVIGEVHFLGQNLRVVNNNLPRGSFGGLLSTGFVNEIGGFQGNIGSKVTLLSTIFDKQVLHIGGGYEYYWTDDPSNKSNVILNQSGTPTPLKNLVQISQFTQDPFKDRDERKNYYFFAQDEWQFAADWRMTIGARFDHFSDFGSSLNPRFSLVWAVSPTLVGKLLYGRAFRPASFLEGAQPSVAGDDIDPETINTVELAVTKRWHHNLFTDLNLFWYRLDNFIQSTPFTGQQLIVPIAFQNSSGLEAYGLEYEMVLEPLQSLTLKFNYAFQHARDKTANSSFGLIPQHQLHVQFDWGFFPSWDLNTRLTWIGERRRQAADPRPDLDDYFIAGLTLRGNDILKHWGIELTINNLFNSDVREPSLDPISLPGDFPSAGRSIIGRLQFRY